MVKNLPTVQDTWVQFLGWEDPLEKETAAHSSILAWRIPWTEEPGGLQCMASRRVGHDWATKPPPPCTVETNQGRWILVTGGDFSDRMVRCSYLRVWHSSWSFSLNEELRYASIIEETISAEIPANLYTAHPSFTFVFLMPCWPLLCKSATSACNSPSANFNLQSTAVLSFPTW